MMRACKKCGFINAEDNLFCENCGQKLIAEQKKKPFVLFFVLPAVSVLMVVAFFLLKGKFSVSKEEMSSLDIPAQYETTALVNETEDWEEQAREADADPDGYKDVKINGADNAYVQVAGVVTRREGMTVLLLPEAVSVCAYNSENKIVQNESIEYFLIKDSDVEEYLNLEAEIKGKLFAEESGVFSLQALKINISQDAGRDEETAFENHRYQLVLKDVTWQEAFEDCKNQGGYLLQINSQEEFELVIQMIEQENMQNVHFYLGGRRDEDDGKYYWVDENNQFTGELLNPEGNTWMSARWMENEPSFISGDDLEIYMNLMYYKDQWVFNDVPADITMYYPGATGYICEFDQ